MDAYDNITSDYHPDSRLVEAVQAGDIHQVRILLTAKLNCRQHTKDDALDALCYVTEALPETFEPYNTDHDAINEQPDAWDTAYTYHQLTLLQQNFAFDRFEHLIEVCFALVDNHANDKIENNPVSITEQTEYAITVHPNEHSNTDIQLSDLENSNPPNIVDTGAIETTPQPDTIQSAISSNPAAKSETPTPTHDAASPSNHNNNETSTTERHSDTQKAQPQPQPTKQNNKGIGKHHTYDTDNRLQSNGTVILIAMLIIIAIVLYLI